MRKSFDTFKQQVGKATSPVVQPPEGASAAAAAQRPTSPADDIPADDPLVDEQQHVHFADDEIPPAVPPEGDAGQLPTTQRRSTHQRLPPERFQQTQQVGQHSQPFDQPPEEHPMLAYDAISDPDTISLHQAMQEPTKKEFDHSTQASFETRLLIHFRDDRHVHAIIDSYVIKADIKSISLIAQRFLTGRFEHLRKVDDDVVHHFAPTALHPLISPITKDGISHLRDNTAAIYDAFIETQWTGHSIPKANGFSQFETIEQDDSEPISFKANLFSKDDFRLRGADTASSAPDESLRSLH
jgi:hypothetical protein